MYSFAEMYKGIKCAITSMQIIQETLSSAQAHTTKQGTKEQKTTERVLHKGWSITKAIVLDL